MSLWSYYYELGEGNAERTLAYGPYLSYVDCLRDLKIRLCETRYIPEKDKAKVKSTFELHQLDEFFRNTGIRPNIIKVTEHDHNALVELLLEKWPQLSSHEQMAISDRINGLGVTHE